MTTTTRTRPRFHVGRALALIAEHRCPCPDCDGSLAASQYPSWRVCTECGCMWREDVIQGRRYACQVRGRCRKEER